MKDRSRVLKKIPVKNLGIRLLIAMLVAAIFPVTAVALPFHRPVLFELLAQAQTTDNRKVEADRLIEQGKQQFLQGHLREALQSYKQALAIRQELNDRFGEAEALNQIGEVYLESLQPISQLWEASIYQFLVNILRHVS